MPSNSVRSRNRKEHEKVPVDASRTIRETVLSSIEMKRTATLHCRWRTRMTDIPIEAIIIAKSVSTEHFIAQNTNSARE